MTVGFYTRIDDEAAELPHPPIPLAILLVVEEALRITWDLMVSKPRLNFDLAKAVEDDVTFELHERLVNEVLKKKVVPGFDRQILANVCREAKTSTYNQSSTDKMPDLWVLFASDFRPTVCLPTQDAIFIECKPVDAQHPAGQDYCDRGLIRFVQGDYAWAMTDALMVAYARPGYTINPKLSDALQTRTKTIPTKWPLVTCSQSLSTSNAEVVQISEHARNFNYPGTEKLAAPIVLRHLWLKRN